MEAKGLHSPLLKCERLTLDTDIRRKVLPGIAHMLDSSRNLETLVISSAPYHCHEVRFIPIYFLNVFSWSDFARRVKNAFVKHQLIY